MTTPLFCVTTPLFCMRSAPIRGDGRHGGERGRGADRQARYPAPDSWVRGTGPGRAAMTRSRCQEKAWPHRTYEENVKDAGTPGQSRDLRFGGVGAATWLLPQRCDDEMLHTETGARGSASSYEKADRPAGYALGDASLFS